MVIRLALDTWTLLTFLCKFGWLKHVGIRGSNFGQTPGTFNISKNRQLLVRCVGSFAVWQAKTLSTSMFWSSITIPLPIDQVGLCTRFCSIKWVPATEWVCTPQLLVSTKWLHAPSDVLMLNVLSEWAWNPFCGLWNQHPNGVYSKSTKWGFSCGFVQSDPENQHKYSSTKRVYSHTSSPRWSLQNGSWEISSTIPIWPQKKSSIKWNWVLRRGTIYKMGSTKRGGSTPPTLTKRWISIWFCSRPHPFCRGNRKGMHNSVAGWPGLDKFSRVQANKGMQPKRAKGSTGRLR